MRAEKFLSIHIRISYRSTCKVILAKSDRISQLADGPIPQLFTLDSNHVNNTKELVSALSAKAINLHYYVLKKFL